VLDILFLYQSFGLILLILLSGFFSGSETALVSLNRIKIKKLAGDGDKRAKIIVRLLKHPNRLLATILVGNNLVNISAAAIATSIAIDLFGSKGVGIATGIMTFLILLFGEITPKGYALANSEKISLSIASPMRYLVKVLYPLVIILTVLTKPLIKKLGGDFRFSHYITEDDIKMLVDVGEKEGAIEKDEKDLIHGVFNSGDTKAGDIMVPKKDIKCLDIKKNIYDAIKFIKKIGFSRIPIYDQSIDNIIGILYSKNIFGLSVNNDQNESFNRFLIPPYFISENKNIHDLLREMQAHKIQMAIIVDDKGITIGLVTMEDVLEELVGEIQDEYNNEE
jgi:CBS domain containing-hemolysin-like protein|tara:strand:- start:2013 stop:3020 length:1008 start_codon:yes stop_codon:yes gene_type:complete